MNRYYELHDSVAKIYGGKYFVIYDVIDQVYNLELTSGAERIWGENGGVVMYLKNRTSIGWKDHPVDMAEFMWVKLRSQEVNVE